MKRDPEGPWSWSAWKDLQAIKLHLEGACMCYLRLPKYAQEQFTQEYPDSIYLWHAISQAEDQLERMLDKHWIKKELIP